MKTTKTQLLPAPDHPLTSAALAQHARAIVAFHGEKILAEVPRAVRRLGTLLLVLSVSIPVFFASLLVVLWHLAH